MTKRKKKKPKKDFRINQYIDELEVIIYEGNPGHLASAIIYYRVGEMCDDCGELYWHCNCEGSRDVIGKCKTCIQGFCLCGYDVWNGNDYDYDKIREEAWKIAKETLNDEHLELLINNVISKYMTDSRNSKFLRRLRKRYDDHNIKI